MSHFHTEHISSRPFSLPHTGNPAVVQVQAVNVFSQRLSFPFETIHHLLRRAEGYATDPHLLLAAIKCCNKLPF